MSTSIVTRRQRQDETFLRRLAYVVLAAAVRGRRGRPGGIWGEAVLAEFGETRGGWEAVRWAAGGLRAVWQERRARVRQLPRYTRISRRIVMVAVIGAVAGFLTNQYALTVRFVPSGGMSPTMLIGERFLIDKLGHRLAGIDHGDIVLVSMPAEAGSPSWTTVKRVVGLPGDTIECRDGKVFRNGRPVDEPYLPADPRAARTDCRTTTVPDGFLYLLGDHREVSRDSRDDVAYRQDTVEGRVLVQLWPSTE
ncbi:signal peptidase I [Couchioplanes caeruleus]|uniref:Signal peptidase I n=2 Tax=Couchioplanes caeruleus TaxID=56438 RepID=A0A1K0FTM2_9ACTN|nr:signal peptidase I [Couchioplanes caeruleus]OJF16016.1 signal peptidase I [Couchioplanes caeruleus subsp. caeruleus]ROP27874.1 signal peptidase I [Couchioplanes caeruleus]